MVTDFSLIKKLIHEKLDHKNLNEILPFNPTAENIARWICDQIPFCFRVEVQESEGNIAIYEKHLMKYFTVFKEKDTIREFQLFLFVFPDVI